MRTAGWLAVAVLAVVLLQCAVGVNGLREKIRNQMVEDVAISDISLLLPYSGKTRVTYELEAYNGCFKWESSHPDVVSVKPLHKSLPDICGLSAGQASLLEGKNGKSALEDAAGTPNPFLENGEDEEKCSTHALVTVTQATSKRAYSWIFAEDTISGRRVRCEVYVDTIRSIQIETTTRSMYHGDSEVLQVQAIDGEGNMFSTLAGLQFKWSLVSLNPASATTALQFLRFVESNIEVPEVMLEMESKGKESYAVLVQGVESGKVNVAARLVEPGTDVAQHVVTISVLEPLQLTPKEAVYITPGTKVQYVLETYKNDYVRAISMPNRQYLWSCGNETVATVNSAGLVVGRQLGSSEVRVQYESMSENYASGDVHVVWPSYITLRIVPFEDQEASGASNWFLVSGRRYVLIVEVFDEDNYRLSSTANLDFNVDLGHKQFFTTVDATENQSRHTLDALKEGLNQVSATLGRFYNPETKSYVQLEPPLVARQEVVISNPVSILGPDELLLPADEACRGRPVQLIAVGGSGAHNWFSADSSVVAVSARGSVTPVSRGSTMIMALDGKNPSNRASIAVHVRDPERIEFVPLYREVPVGRFLDLPVRALDKDGHAFSNCSCMHMTWEVQNNDVFVFAEEGDSSSGRGCLQRTLKATKEGQSTVTVTYRGSKADIIIFAFKPLEMTPKSSLVTLGGSSIIRANGGPSPWYREPGLFEANLFAERPSDVLIARGSSHGDRFSFKVTCKAHGNQTLTLRVGNRPSKLNEFPASVEQTTVFMCYPPTSVFVYPDVTTDDVRAHKANSRCGDSSWTFPTLDSIRSGAFSGSSEYSIKNNQALPIRVTALGPTGEPYDDLSSLNIEWKSNNGKVADFTDVASCEGKDLCTLDVGDEGSVGISVSILGYNRQKLQALGVHTTPSLQNQADLSKNVDFKLLTSVLTNPPIVHIYAHKDNYVQLSTDGGSGVFDFASNNTAVVEVQMSPSGDSIRAVPLQAGTAKITVVDQCLYGSRNAVSVIHVSQISSIQLRVADMMPVGSQLDLDVLVYDSYNNLFDESQYSFMELTAHVGETIVNLERVLGSESRYIVHGVSAGQGRISFSAVQSTGQVITSPSKLIHVYPPFKLSPADAIYLLPSVPFQLDWEGGPPVGAKVTFEVEQERVATVDSIGVVTARSLGETVVHAYVEGYDSITGEKTRYGEDSTRVIVKTLEGIRIFAPSSTIVTGTEMTLRVVGLNGENPFSFASSAVRFAWDTSNVEVAALVPNYRPANVSLSAEGMFSVRLHAKKLGQTRITAFVQSAPDQLEMRGLSASAQINVVDRLELLSPSTLLLSPFATYQLRTTLDGSVTYTIACPCSCDECEKVATVSASGKVEVGSRPGTTLVVVEHKETGQSEVVLIEVKPVDMVQLLLSGKGDGDVYYSMPVGSSMALDAVFRDNLGRTFDGMEDTPLKFSASNREVVAVSKVSHVADGVDGRNHQVFVDALQPGEALLQVAARSQQTEGLVDFIHILVGNAILPPAPTVHIGGAVQFSTSYESSKSSNRDPGHWRSDNPTVLEIDASTGLATAKKAGTATIEHVGRVTTTTFVTVSRVEDVRIDTSDLQELTNFGSEADYMVPVSFYSKEGSKMAAEFETVRHGIQFTCTVNPSVSASARAVTDEETGETFCALSLTPAGVTKHQKQPFGDALQLQVTAQDSRGSYETIGTRTVPYYPAVVIVDAPPTVQLATNKLYYRMQVKHGRSEPVVFSSDTSLLSVLRSSKHSDTSTYEIGVVDPSQPFDEAIFLQVASTGQKETVRVVYSAAEPDGNRLHPQVDSVPSGLRASERMPAANDAQLVFVPPESELSGVHFLLVICLTLLALAAGYIFCTPSGAQLVMSSAPKAAERPAPSTPSAITANSRRAAPGTPRTPLFPTGVRPGSGQRAPMFTPARTPTTPTGMHQRYGFAASPLSPPTPLMQ